MDNKIKKINRNLLIYFITAIVVSVVAFILTVTYTQKYEIDFPNIILERYGILITLIGIPLALKMFHSWHKKQKDGKVNVSLFLKKYQLQYLLRLGILELICFFNIISLYITGSKNFYFMVIVTIFAFFLCAPQKAHLDIEENESDDNQQ